MQIQWIRTQDKNDLWSSVTYDPCFAGEGQYRSLQAFFLESLQSPQFFQVNLFQLVHCKGKTFLQCFVFSNVLYFQVLSIIMVYLFIYFLLQNS